VGTFVDADPNASAGDYTATIFWGDNTSSAASFTLSGGTFSVHGSHTYAEEGTYHPYAVVTDDEGDPNLTTGRSSVTTSQTLVTVTVADAPLTSTGTAVTPVTGTVFTGVVASFTDADPAGTATDYQAMITWGNGNSSTGTISANGSGGFNVVGSNTYGADGTFPILVTITDAGGKPVPANGTAYVGGLATQFSVKAATAVAAGTPLAVTVQALDAAGNPAYSYAGKVDFTSTDAKAMLPMDYIFSAGDLGMHLFSVTLKTVGTQSVTATDTANGTIKGKQGGIVVSPGVVSQFQVVPSTTSTNSVTPGTSLKFKVTAQDAFGNTLTGYRGTVHLTSTDSQAVLPTDYPFTTSDAGVAVLKVTLNTTGSQTVTVTDSANGAVTGTSRPVLVTTITNAGVSQLSQYSAVITWSTTRPATGQVFYRVMGTSTWQASPFYGDLVTSHAITLTGLQPGTTYECYVQSFDQNGVESDSWLLSFRTLR
jgi:hypothetical protein